MRFHSGSWSNSKKCQGNFTGKMLIVKEEIK